MQKDAGWRIDGKIPRVDCIELGEMCILRRAVDVTLDHPLQGRTSGLQTPLHLIEDDFGLSSERQTLYVSGFRVNGGRPDT